MVWRIDMLSAPGEKMMMTAAAAGMRVQIFYTRPWYLCVYLPQKLDGHNGKFNISCNDIGFEGPTAFLIQVWVTNRI